MPLRFPERMFHPLADLAEDWNVCLSDLSQWMISGTMTGVAWLPLMSVIELGEGQDGDYGTPSLGHWEGYVRMSDHQCRRVFRTGWITLREFCTQDGQRGFRLPDTSDDLIIELDDLVVLEAERRRMEARYPVLISSHRSKTIPDLIGPHSNPCANEPIDPTYRIVAVDGKVHRFGETQSRVLRLLAEAARRGEPWQSGKLLLSAAGSQSYSVSNLFKRHPVWKEIVLSNRRGFYRIDERYLNSERQAQSRLQQA